MEINKKNKHCCYNDEQHVYWNENDNTKYVSVTTLIGKYHSYDSDFWSSYKAFEKLYLGEDVKEIKKNLRKAKRFYIKLEDYGIDKLEFNTEKQDILDAWEANKNVACERGTKIHNMKENEFYVNDKHELSQFGLSGSYNCAKDNYELNSIKGVYPEYLVYYESPDKLLKIAGQIDLLVKDGNDIYIIDYKTNKEIKTEGFYDEATKKPSTMHYPLNNIQDCNYYHYNLQLSLYAWMINKINPEYNVKGLIIIHYDHNDKVTTYRLDYLKDPVERMLKHYKKNIKVNLEKEKLKPIIF